MDGLGGDRRRGGARAPRPDLRVRRGGGGTRALVGLGVAHVLLAVAALGVVLLLAGMGGRPRAADFGLRRPALGRALGLALAVWVGLALTTVLWVSALGLDGQEGQG